MIISIFSSLFKKVVVNTDYREIHSFKLSVALSPTVRVRPSHFQLILTEGDFSEGASQPLGQSRLARQLLLLHLCPLPLGFGLLAGS